MSVLEVRCRLAYAGGFVVDAAFASEAAVTALFGPSGSGKTSLLSIIAGLRRPDSGLIRLGDDVLFDDATGVDLAPEKRRLGYVFQQHLLFPHLDVRGNLLYGWKRRPAGTSGAEPDAVIALLDLAPSLDRRPAALSGGERQRVALGRALLCAPRLLLLDEPLASVDDERKLKVLDYLQRIFAEWRIPTLYVTHDAAEAARMCQWMVFLHDGAVRAQGPPSAAALAPPSPVG